MKKASAGILTALLVLIGMAVWTSRTVSAHQPAHSVSVGGWHQRLHNELMGMLPERVQQKMHEWHGSH